MRLVALLLLALLAVPSIADAQLKNKVMVLWHQSNEDPTSGFNRLRDRTPNVLRALREAGIAFDVFTPQDSRIGRAGVDDSVWVADPIAPRAADPDFGVTNSALVVHQE